MLVAFFPPLRSSCRRSTPRRYSELSVAGDLRSSARRWAWPAYSARWPRDDSIGVLVALPLALLCLYGARPADECGDAAGWCSESRWSRSVLWSQLVPARAARVHGLPGARPSRADGPVHGRGRLGATVRRPICELVLDAQSPRLPSEVSSGCRRPRRRSAPRPRSAAAPRNLLDLSASWHSPRSDWRSSWLRVPRRTPLRASRCSPESLSYPSVREPLVSFSRFVHLRCSRCSWAGGHGSASDLVVVAETSDGSRSLSSASVALWALWPGSP